MIKSISKISLILFITFLSGLVMTDCVLPEIQSEERAEIEIEEENEVEIINLVQSELQSVFFDGGNGEDDTYFSLSSIIPHIIEINDDNYSKIGKLNPNRVIVLINKVPKYILFGSLKLYS